MKPFIVFLAVLMMFSMCFSYAGDYQMYMAEDAALKAEAEECAATAALELDPRAFAEGEVRIDPSRAEAAANSHFDYYLAHQCRVKVKDAQIEVVTGNLPSNMASVTVYLYLETEDIFRLSFLRVEKLCRMSTYEYV